MTLDFLLAIVIPCAFFLIILFLIFSYIFNYHWNKYSYDDKLIKKMKQIYYDGAIAILAVVILSSAMYYFFL